ncbi:MAG: hypothetical protein AAF799_24865 [Myxococcota bacterium]
MIVAAMPVVLACRPGSSPAPESAEASPSSAAEPVAAAEPEASEAPARTPEVVTPPLDDATPFPHVEGVGSSERLRTIRQAMVARGLPDGVWVRISTTDIATESTVVLELDRGSIPGITDSEQAKTVDVPELVQALKAAAHEAPEGVEKNLVLLGDQNLRFFTLTATMRAAGQAGLTTYAFLVEEPDGTVRLRAEEE